MQMPTPTWTLPQLLWIKENEPENYQRIDRLMFTKDYVRSWITGDFCTDVVDAQGSLLYDARQKKWSEELCGMIDLPEGLAVIAGCSDTAAEDFSAGAEKLH